LSSTMLTNMCFQSNMLNIYHPCRYHLKVRVSVRWAACVVLCSTQSWQGCNIRLHRSNSCVMPCTATSLLNFSMQLKWWAFQNRFSINWLALENCHNNVARRHKCGDHQSFFLKFWHSLKENLWPVEDSLLLFEAQSAFDNFWLPELSPQLYGY
jgi:hypothetical protein